MNHFRRSSRTSSLILVALLVGPAVAALGDELETSTFELQMQAQGWSQVTTGVFERQLGEHRVERKGYGPAGYAAALNDLSHQVDRLMVEFDREPSYEIARSIEDLTAAIARLRADLATLLRTDGLESAPQALDGPNCSSTCFTATADAYPLSATQGVGAVAEATFNSSCGILGETMSTAVARAYQGTTLNLVNQEDSKNGNPITSRVSAQALGGNGAQSCFSLASALVSSSQLGFVYTTFDYSDGVCPAPPPTCSISGSSYVVLEPYSCTTETWYANVSGGTPPYTYSWGGDAYSETLCPYQGQTWIDLTVTDSAGQQCNTSLYVWVETNEQNCYPYWNCPLPY